MILEVASISISDGRQREFEAALIEAQQVLMQAEGYVRHEFKKCMEVPNRYILLITWQSLEAHTESFRASELYKEWRALIGDFFSEAPEVLHYESF